MSDPAALLAARQRTHGSFIRVSWVVQLLRDIWRHELGWERLTPVKREAMDCIAMKQARILSGDPNCEDHWMDIQGYAELALIEIRETEKAGP